MVGMMVVVMMVVVILVGSGALAGASVGGIGFWGVWGGGLGAG